MCVSQPHGGIDEEKNRVKKGTRVRVVQIHVIPLLFVA